MTWKIEFKDKAKKQLKKLGKPIQIQIEKHLLKLIKLGDPRQTGKALTGSLKGFWRFRVGDYRLICDIKDVVVTIVIIKVAHRKDVYKKEIV